MSKKYPGGYLTKTPPTVSQTSAPGIWTLEQAEYYQQAGQWPVPPDPYFNQVSLLLHGDGTNGAQNNTFVDSSTNNFTITRTGNVAQGTFSPFSLADGQWSNYFDGSGDYLTVPDSTAFDLNGQAFTIEMWLNPSALPASEAMLVGQNQLGSFGEWDIRLKSNGYIVWPNSAGTTLITSTSTVSLGVWTHIAITSNGSTISMYKDGVYQGQTSTAFVNSTRVLSIAAGATGTAPYTGYISNLRIVKGTAVYTANFTPPTSALTAITNTSLLTCQSNRFIDNSSNNFTITRNGDTKVTAFSPFAPSAAYSASTNGGSGYFDGSGDYLQAPTSTSLDFGTGDFTVEAWVNTTNLSGQNTIIDMRPVTTNGAYLLFAIKTTGVLFIVVSSLDRITSSSGAIQINTWNHVAVSRSSGNTKMFINGVQAGSTWSDTTNYTADAPRIGQSKYSGFPENFNGYMADVRIVNGTALYTANFTPPTAPLTAVTNTQLLLNCTNAGIIDNAGKNDIETVGNAQISTSVKKYGTGSMYFDGTGDYLVNQGNIDSFTFGTGNFTIEFWIYLNNVTQTSVIFDTRPSGTNGLYPMVYTATGAFRYLISGTVMIQSSTYSATTWHHVAVCRSGTATKMFVNGNQSGSTYTDSNNYLCAASRPFIGINSTDLSAALNGYIDDLRVTKGVARYTANFVPPNGPFPNV